MICDLSHIVLYDNQWTSSKMIKKKKGYLIPVSLQTLSSINSTYCIWISSKNNHLIKQEVNGEKYLVAYIKENIVDSIGNKKSVEWFQNIYKNLLGIINYIRVISNKKVHVWENVDQCSFLI